MNKPVDSTLSGMIRFQKKYFLAAVLLFIIEVLIALYMHDRIVRPYIGDLLVVILIYCFVKAFFDFPVLHTAIGVLLFAYLIEFSQYLNLVKHLGLENSKLATAVMGSSFEWIDMLAYTLGILLVISLEKLMPDM